MNVTKVITGVNTRWSYANVWDPKSINGGAPKYSVSLIIPKSDTATVEKIKAAIQAAYEEGESKLKGNGKTVPALSVLKTPLRDGDLERPDDEAYKGCYFINANSAKSLNTSLSSLQQPADKSFSSPPQTSSVVFSSLHQERLAPLSLHLLAHGQP